MTVSNSFNATLGQLAAQSQASSRNEVPFWDDAIGYTDSPQGTWSRWDVVLVNSQPLPGIGKIIFKKKPKIRTQKRDQAGADGDQPIMIGYSPAELTVELTIWTPRQLLELENFTILSNVFSTSGSGSQAEIVRLVETPKLNKFNTTGSLVTLPTLDIYHPSLILANITRMYVYSIVPPEEGRVPGTKIFRIEGYEYFDLTVNQKSAQAKVKPPAPPPAKGIEQARFFPGGPPGASATQAGYPPGKNQFNYTLPTSEDTPGPWRITPGSDPAMVNPSTRAGE